jgi:hypothetical protein
LVELMPTFTTPDKVPLYELNLAANGLTDDVTGELIARIIVAHCEYRDQVYWKYGLRNEVPESSAVIGLKKLDLSFNKLGEKACRYIGQALKADRYLLSLNLRSNLI